MGRDLAEAFPAARQVFEQAASETGLDLVRLCFEGPLEQLSRSDVAQPAILTASVAALRAMQQAAGRPPAALAAAGLSLGEYSALVAAGALEFGPAVRLVQRRGRYMQEACEANPGTMYSIIGLEDGLVKEACEAARRESGGGVWPANYNCPGQLVISGEEQAAAAAARRCSELGARKAIRLNVAGAFHTELMRPAADRLAEDLADAPIGEPRCPVVANVTGRPVTEPEDVRRLLVEQITGPVRWHDSMRWLADQGAEEFYEIGPGRVLQGLLRRIDRSRKCITISGEQDVRAYAAQAGQGRAPAAAPSDWA
jgi:[acyl-carrier-protein] S-malonyltransferase